MVPLNAKNILQLSEAKEDKMTCLTEVAKALGQMFPGMGYKTIKTVHMVGQYLVV
jgi:hypothetical protein